MDATARLHAAYDARFDIPDDTSRTIGCISAVAPIELILAAGLIPFRLHGRPSQMPTNGDTYMEEEVDGEVRSVFDTLLRGTCADLPLVLLPRISEQHLQLHYYVGEVRKWEPKAQIPPVQIVDVMQTPNWSTGRYIRERLDELARDLGQIGTPVTEASLKDAITKTNAMRRALQDLNALRRDGHLPGSDLLRMTNLMGTLPPDDFLALAADLKAEAGPARTAPRVMLSGASLDDPGLYELIESKGALVAADDHVTGERLYAHLVDETADPLDALTEHYQLHAPGLRQFPQSKQDARFFATCKDAAIDADLCVLEDCDDTLGWDWPKRRDALAAMNIHSTLLTGQNYFAPDRAAQSAAIDDLLSRIGKGAA